MQFGVKSKNANENQHYSKLSSKDVNREIGPFRLTYQLQGCQNVLASAAITSYFEFFAGCKLLKKSEKKGQLKSCKIGNRIKEIQIVSIMP